jgi:hypothetical protein
VEDELSMAMSSPFTQSFIDRTHAFSDVSKVTITPCVRADNAAFSLET